MVEAQVNFRRMPCSLNSNGGWAVQAGTSLANTRLFTYAGEIDSAVLMIHGEKAHSCYMSQDAFRLLKGDNKELLIIPDAVHTPENTVVGGIPAKIIKKIEV